MAVHRVNETKRRNHFFSYVRDYTDFSVLSLNKQLQEMQKFPQHVFKIVQNGGIHTAIREKQARNLFNQFNALITEIKQLKVEITMILQSRGNQQYTESAGNLEV